MFGIGFFELCVIVVVALVFVGPQKLPTLMRQLGKFFVQVRRMSSDIKSSVDQVMQDAEEELRQEQQKKLEAAIEKRMTEKDKETLKDASPTDKEDEVHAQHEAHDPLAIPHGSHPSSFDHIDLATNKKEEEPQAAPTKSPHPQK